MAGKKFHNTICMLVILSLFSITLTGCASSGKSVPDEIYESVEDNEKIDHNNKESHNSTENVESAEDIDNIQKLEQSEVPDIEKSKDIRTLAPIEEPAHGCSPSEHNFKWEVMKDGKIVDDYIPEYEVIFAEPEFYSDVQGITTFRGNPFRDCASYSNVEVNEESFEKVWSIKTGYIDTYTTVNQDGQPGIIKWTGVGWNGQPATVKWDEEVRNIMNIFPEKKQKDNLVEVICAALDGKIYFLDLEDGQYTRNPIDIVLMLP
ncbi:MAG: hypothetical protein ACOX7R_01955, partial [Acetivibrionales bacterium]